MTTTVGFGEVTVGEVRMDGATGRLWLERTGDPVLLDDRALEHASLAARIMLGHQRTRHGTDPTDGALVEMVLCSREPPADRCRALRRLGLVPDHALRVIAVSAAAGRDPAAEALGLLARDRSARTVCATVISGVAAVLFQSGKATESPADELRETLRDRTRDGTSCAGLRVGIGSSVEGTSAAESWERALLASRFALPAPAPASGRDAELDDAVVDHDALGVLALLAEVPRGNLMIQPDVVALNKMGSTNTGALDIVALEAFCRMGSLRQAAQLLYLHHSTVAARLVRVADAMGWNLDDPADRFRAQFALWARRLVLPVASR